MAVQNSSEGRAPARSPGFVTPDTLVGRMETLRALVAERAFERFVLREGENGDATDDWLRAEASLLEPVRAEVLRSDTQVTVRAEVPGFDAGELAVSVEPRRLMISGTRQGAAEECEGRLVFTERNWRELFRAIELPLEVDPAAATARLVNGVLIVTLPRAGGATEAGSHGGPGAG